VPLPEYSFALVRRALSRGAWLVLMRSKRLWFAAVPELASYPRLIRIRNVQNPVISHRKIDGDIDALVKAVGVR
jgi:hypothetical protein